MDLSPQAQALLLLTVSLGAHDEAPAAKPLSAAEWSRLARWLTEQGRDPATLLDPAGAGGLAESADPPLDPARLQILLRRGAALGLALERWQRAGLWVLTRADPAYPERLKARLRAESPPVLFGCGDPTRLKGGGVAIVGARDADATARATAGRLATQAAAEGYTVVSGGARGIDQIAVQTALAAGGSALAILPDGLLRQATTRAHRPALLDGRLTLVSPFHPEAGFHVGLAMARNRVVHCLGDASVVVACRQEQGGSWAGAVEVLKAGWVPLWVLDSSDPDSGTAELIRRGARPLPESGTIDQLTRPLSPPSPPAPPVGPRQLDLFGD